jgi:hypothetical protein
MPQDLLPGVKAKPPKICQKIKKRMGVISDALLVQHR